MNKTSFKTMVLAALMAFPTLSKAQTFAGIEAEKSAQNTPTGWTAVQLPELPEITSANTVTVSGLSATGDNTTVIQNALNNVSSNGGMIVIPAGTWVCGPLQVKSKTVLHLAKDCTLKLQPYGTYPNDKSNFIREKKNATDIIIEGEDKETSIIDGQGEAWWKALDADTELNRGAIIRFNSGQRFLIRNLTCKNAPGANITLGNKSANGNSSYRLNATVHDVNIYAPASELSKTGSVYPSHNTDGIPIWDPYVNIYNCDISNGDDNIVCDSYAQYVHVWNCTFGTGHGASIGSYTVNVKHVWFDQIDMNGTTAGIRMKTGINSDGTLRGGGEEDWKFTNFTMTKVANPFSIDCYYDKNYNSDPAVDKANARTLDNTTPTYNGILLQNVKTTDVCSGNAIFLIGRPESHIKNITLDNVQISAQKGIDIRFVDNLVFKNNSKITATNGNIWIRSYDSSYDDQCNATSSSATPVIPTEGEDISYVLSSSTCTSATDAVSPWTFSNGCTITNTAGKKYATAKSNTLKYSKGTQFTITLPENITITKVTIAGYSNEDNNKCYLAEVNGNTYSSTDYIFPDRKATTSTDTKAEITLSTPATGSITFTPQDAQAAWVITLTGKNTSSTAIAQIKSDTAIHNENIYDLAGRIVKQNASAKDIQDLNKGIYIYNNKKYVVK